MGWQKQGPEVERERRQTGEGRPERAALSTGKGDYAFAGTTALNSTGRVS